jgi:hypothetical protein
MIIKVLMLSLMLLAIPSETEDFVPKDVTHAVAMGCMISGVKDAPPFAESQVFVSWSPTGHWDYRPIISRHELTNGGVYSAIDDCIEWLGKVKKKIEATAAEGKASK